MKRYLLAGLLAWAPIGITLWVLTWLLGSMDGLFSLLLRVTQAILPPSSHEAIEGLRHVPGLSVIVLVTLLLLTGVFVTNVVGQWVARQWNKLLRNIPIVKSIYSSVKQVSDTLFSSNGNAFREAVLVQYPRAGAWTVAFVTGKPGGEVARHLGSEHLSIYVPTTPNPTSGFFLMVPRADVVALDMSVDQALKYIISMGVVVPPPTSPPPARPGEADPNPRG
jgi:uncharacterized membrane protein